MNRDKAIKTTFAHYPFILEIENQIAVAAQNGCFQTMVNIERDQEKLQLFTYWAYFNNYRLEDVTLPQHHNYMYIISWRPYYEVEVNKDEQFEG